MSVVGFDIGTSNCRISCWWGTSRPEVIYNMPTVISVTEENEILVGEDALPQKYPTTTIYDTKRILGSHFGGETEREKKEFQKYQTLWPFCVETSKKQTYQYCLKVKDELKIFTVEDILSVILKRLKNKTEELLGIENLQNIVITIPAYYDNTSRVLTQEIAKSVGLNVVRMITDTSAASLTYGIFDKSTDVKKNVLLFSMGGGSVSVSIFQISKGQVQTKAACGNRFIGGIDFENEIFRLCCAKAKLLYEEPILGNSEALMKLKLECSKAMKVLDEEQSYQISIKDHFKGKDFEWEFKKETFEKANKKNFEEILDPILDVMDAANMTKKDLNEIILIGGASRIPKLKALLKKFFKKQKFSENLDIDNMVSIGASIQATMLDTVKATPTNNKTAVVQKTEEKKENVKNEVQNKEETKKEMKEETKIEKDVKSEEKQKEKRVPPTLPNRKKESPNSEPQPKKENVKEKVEEKIETKKEKSEEEMEEIIME
eukprot:gene690-8942_t